MYCPLVDHIPACIGRGCTCQGVYLSRGVPVQGGVPAGGCTCPVDVPAQGGVPAWRGVPAQGGVPARGVPAQVLPTCEQNDRQVQNITLPQTSFVGGNYRETGVNGVRCAYCIF